MSFIHIPVLAGASGNQGTYEIEQSLRSGSDDDRLDFTPSSDGNRKTWTWSGWIKRGELGTEQHFFQSWNGSGDVMLYARFHSNDTIRVKQFDGSDVFELQTNAVFRDPSAWYHIVLRFDTTQSTASDRAKIYVNGELQSLGTASYPSQNADLFVNRGSYVHILFRDSYSTGRSFFGYMAEVHHVDGTALDPTDFGVTNSNGVWVPIEYTGGSYGTNGFYMKFDETATNGIGHDHSGNGNNFTASGFTTSGSGTDVLSDTPTTNWCTVNPLSQRQYLTTSNGNLQINYNNSGNGVSITGTQGASSGKWYWETTMTTASGADYVGVVTSDWDVMGKAGAAYPGSQDNGWTYFRDGRIYHNGSFSSYGNSYTTGDIIGLALDLDNDKIYFSKNGIYQNSSNPTTGTNPAFSNVSGTVFPVWAGYNTSTVHTCNFGQREFLYPPGTYSASAYFNTVLWTGDNNDDRSITVGFQPDLVWYKRRNLSASHLLFDSVRGATKALSSNNTTTENTEANALQAFETNGFQVGSDANSNSSSYNYVAWCWKAGGTASSNPDGSITASVSASDAAGFSVVKFEGNNTAGASVGHGLSTAPSFIITKNIDNSSAYWATYIASAGKSKKFYINDNQAPDAAANWLDVSDSTITWNQTDVNNVNTNNNTFICYCWAEKTGVSKFGSYTGNGSTDGPLISDLGFAPALVVIKKDSSASEWAVYDSARGDNTQLRWDAPDQDNTNSAVNVRLTNNGFKIETSDSAQNGDGALYYYMAWARASSTDEDFKSLNTANLPAPDIKDGSKYFNTVIYTGASPSDKAVTGVGFQPSFTWIKARTQAYSHALYDAVRGATKELHSDTNDQEDTDTNGLKSFDSDGFTVGSDGEVGDPTGTRVAWNWLAGGSGSSNTNGSITSTVSVSPSGGFSIVSYTAENAVRTVGHGLGVAPKFIIVKDREATSNWAVYHESMGNTKAIYLDVNLKNDTNSGYWNNTSPTSTVFTIGTNTRTGGSTNDYIAYCFAEVEGYSKMGSYTGNGSSDGPFIYTGFRPAFILFKNYAGGSEQSWTILDNTRDTYNAVQKTIYPDVNNAEDGTVSNVDFCANGFKLRNAWQNESGSDHLYVAFAENPFGGDGVSPATAR